MPQPVEPVAIEVEFHDVDSNEPPAATPGEEPIFYDEGDSDASSGIASEVEARAGQFHHREDHVQFHFKQLLEGMGSSEDDPRVYRERQEKAIARQMELEHWSAFSYWRFAINMPWKNHRGTTGFNNVEKTFKPPDFDKLWNEYVAKTSSPATPKTPGGLNNSRTRGETMEMDEYFEPRNGFDLHFQKWLGDTKPGQWPLPKHSKHTLNDAGALAVTHAFAVFVAKWKGFWWGCLGAVVEGAGYSMLPQIMGMMTSEVSSGVNCPLKLTEDSCLESQTYMYYHCNWNPDLEIEGQFKCESTHGFLRLGMWCVIYWLCYQTAIWADWISFYWAKSSSTRRDLRSIILGRMLKFRPLPNPGEAAHLLHEGVYQAVGDCWWAVFCAIKESVGFVFALWIIILNFHTCLLDLILLFVLPMALMIVITALFYAVRRRNAHDMARRRYHWYSRFYGYVYSLTAILAPMDANDYDIDAEVSMFHRLGTILMYRHRGLHFWKLSSVRVVENICSSLAMVMIFLAGWSAFHGNLATGNFVSIAGSTLRLVTESSRLMKLLTKKSSGYECILRIAKVLNNSELKACYNQRGRTYTLEDCIKTGAHHAISTITTGAHHAVSTIKTGAHHCISWLQKIDLRNLAKSDIQKIHELDPSDLHDLRDHEDFDSTGVKFHHLVHLKHFAHVHVSKPKAAGGGISSSSGIIDDHGLEKLQQQMNAELDRAQTF